MTANEAQLRRERLAVASAEAARRIDRAWSERKHPHAEPGDLYVLPAKADGVWALVAHRPRRPRLFLAVPGDTGPALESTDVGVPESEECGALTLRCRDRVWLAESALEPDLYVGSLSPGALEAVRTVVDRLGEEGRPGVAGETLAAPREREPNRRRRPVLLAYAAAAAVALGFAGWLAQHRQLVRLQAERAAVTAALAQERGRRITAEQERSRAEEELRRLAEAAPVPRPPDDDVLLSLPLAFLDPVGALRGEAEEVRVPAGSRWVGLVLYLTQDVDYPRYRLTLLPANGDRILWRSEPFSPPEPDEIHLALPRRLLAPGTYRLHLEGLRTDEAVSVADYQLAVVP